MICPHCQAEGRESRVTQGASERGLVYIPITYDEAGQVVPGPHAPTRTRYTCSNGHHSDPRHRLLGEKPCRATQTAAASHARGREHRTAAAAVYRTRKKR